MPAFSIIVPAYNRAALLVRCLHSVQAQRFADWECIVVDDGSVDATPAVAARFAHVDTRFRCYSQANAGAAAARNRGIAAAQGDWLCFLDADDYYYPETLETFAAVRDAVREHPAHPAILCGVVSTDLSPVNLLEMNGQLRILDAFASTYGVRRDAPIVFLQPTAFARSLVEHIAPFNATYPAGEDREFAIRACTASPVAEVQSLVACYTKAHGGGKSDRYLVNGVKLAATRHMYDDLHTHPLLVARFGRGQPEHARYVQWHGCHRAMLDCASAMRAGEFAQAAQCLQLIQAAAHHREEVMSLVKRLNYFVYYPPTDSVAARAQCAAWFHAVADAMHAGPGNLRALVRGIAQGYEQADGAQ